MTRPAATRQYPHVKPDLPARTRGVIALIEENCTVCMLCSRECPDWCIYIDSHKEQVAPKEGGRARTRNLLDRFAIDFALCMYCGICVEVCPFDALHWSPEFEYAEHQVEKLTHEMDTLRTWAYSVPAPDPLEEGAVEPKEIESARKAREAVAAKAAAAAEEARAATPAPAPAAAPAAAGPAPTVGAAPASAPTGGAPASADGAGAGTTTAAARPADVEVEPGIDQATYDRLLAAGEPDRTARAKAKAAYMRRAKAEARAAQAAGAAEAAPAPVAPAEAGPPSQPSDGGEAPAAEAGSAAPGSVETPVAAVAAPETAPPAPSAAGTPEAAEPAADARDPEARSPEGEQTSSGTAVDVAPGAAVAQADAEHLEIEVDQETYDRLIEAGEPERTARAKAKAAYARKLRAAQRGGGAGS
jgi:formate hydrogenlyase subunit 6/NADH:ubiquinone oxidoreductase subunit I